MRFYLDTSVFGGYFDEEFKDDTVKFFEEIQKHPITIVYSEITNEELIGAPDHVKDILYKTPSLQLEFVRVTDASLKLSEQYIKEGALTKKFINDAQHIALASIHRVDALVSWNFKHLVNFFRIRQYNSVNLKNGYPFIDIRSPKEVII